MERSFRHEIGHGSDAERHGDRVELPVVGKRTLVQMLEAMTPAPPSREVPGRVSGEDPHIARQRVTGPRPPLPRGDRIQAFFGRRDGAGAQGHGRGAGADLGPQGAGTPLQEPVRQKMERAFGQDFSDVRVHQGPRAAALGALAYTQGTDIHFAPGQYEPESPAGQALLGHELAHVVQQRQGRVSTTTQARIAGAGVNDDPALEREAD
jgi:hypothetical protein